MEPSRLVILSVYANVHCVLYQCAKPVRNFSQSFKRFYGNLICVLATNHPDVTSLYLAYTQMFNIDDNGNDDDDNNNRVTCCCKTSDLCEGFLYT